MKRIVRLADPNCEWCAGRGVRGSKPFAWYADRQNIATTIWGCNCVREEELVDSEDQAGDA